MKSIEKNRGPKFCISAKSWRSMSHKWGLPQISRPPSLESGQQNRPSHGPAMKTCLGHGTTGPRVPRLVRVQTPINFPVKNSGRLVDHRANRFGLSIKLCFFSVAWWNGSGSSRVDLPSPTESGENSAAGNITALT